MRGPSDTFDQSDWPFGGLEFIDCGLTVSVDSMGQAGAGGAQPGPRRREVVVNGRRVKTIDVHAHCVIPEAHALLGLRADVQRGPGIDEVGPRRIREMASRA